MIGNQLGEPLLRLNIQCVDLYHFYPYTKDWGSKGPLKPNIWDSFVSIVLYNMLS